MSSDPPTTGSPRAGAFLPLVRAGVDRALRAAAADGLPCPAGAGFTRGVSGAESSVRQPPRPRHGHGTPASSSPPAGNMAAALRDFKGTVPNLTRTHRVARSLVSRMWCRCRAFGTRTGRDAAGRRAGRAVSRRRRRAVAATRRVAERHAWGRSRRVPRALPRKRLRASAGLSVPPLIVREPFGRSHEERRRTGHHEPGRLDPHPSEDVA